MTSYVNKKHMKTIFRCKKIFGINFGIIFEYKHHKTYNSTIHNNSTSKNNPSEPTPIQKITIIFQDIH